MCCDSTMFLLHRHSEHRGPTFPDSERSWSRLPPQLSRLGRAAHALMMAAQRVAARYSIRRLGRRLNRVEHSLQLVCVLWWYVCGFVTETQVHVVLWTKMSLKVSLLRVENV